MATRGPGMRNEIILNGVRHILREDGGFYPCRQCSMHDRCETDPLCQKLFGVKGHFEIYKSKEK